MSADVAAATVDEAATSLVFDPAARGNPGLAGPEPQWRRAFNVRGVESLLVAAEGT